MKVATVNVIGTRPLLFHSFNVESVTSISKVKEGSAGNNPNEWKKTFFEKGNQLYLPGTYWSSVLKDGSRHTKAGRGSIQKSFVSCMIVKTDISLLNRYICDGWQEMSSEQMTKDASQPVYLDIRGVMNPNSKGRNVRYRIACSEGWKCQFSFSFDDTIVSTAQVKKIVEDSGKMSGIGDGRTLGYGRFRCEEITFETEKDSNS